MEETQESNHEKEDDSKILEPQEIKVAAEGSKTEIAQPDKVASDVVKPEEDEETGSIQHDDTEAHDIEEYEQAPDLRNVRRIIAEDPEYNLATVAELEIRTLNKIIDNFAFNANMYTSLKQAHKKKVLQKISLSIPLKVVADLIEDGEYWKRKCQNRWSLCDISHYGKSWKRMFFERNLEEIIENFVPDKTDRTCLEDTLALSAPYVERLIITQMLPPIKEEPKPSKPMDDDMSDAESEIEEVQKIDHLVLNPIVMKLPNLTELRLTYDVKNIGMNFEWNVFQFTVKDCQDLSLCIAEAKNLKVFHLTRSRVDCDRCRLLISKFLDHPNLVELDLSNNHIGDRGSRAIGKMLNNHCVLERLILSCNQIKPAGAHAIAFGLSKNDTLKHLDLRLNRLADDGGQSLAKSLLINSTLTSINLASNDLSEPTAAILAQVIKKNKSLTNIDLSNNRLGPDGGKQIQEGIKDNRRLLSLDLRFTDCGDEAVFSISQIISYNQKLRMYDLETDKEILEAVEGIKEDLKMTIFSDNSSIQGVPSSRERTRSKMRSGKSTDLVRPVDADSQNVTNPFESNEVDDDANQNTEKVPLESPKSKPESSILGA